MHYVAIIAVLLIGGGLIYQQTQSEPTIVREEPRAVVVDETQDTEVNDAMVDTSEITDDEVKVGDAVAAVVEETTTEPVVEEVEEETEEDIGVMTAIARNNETRTMIVAGGCFWCVEADLEKLPGVIEAVSGYSGGDTENPTYGTYAKGGHREVVEVTYNPNTVSFEEILIYAMKHMDPTDPIGSFGDRGVYYSPAFYYETSEEKAIIDNLIDEVNERGPYNKPLAIAVEERAPFFEAEDFHQNYYKGALSQFKYRFYREASGRDDFIEEFWGDDTGPDLPWRSAINTNNIPTFSNMNWKNFQKPSDDELRNSLNDIQYKVTQKNGTERAFQNEYYDNKEEGIYVDIVSGEPLFSSTHKFDSGTGWPSFTRPIEYDFVTEHADYKLIVKRTEIRSSIADSHLGHVFNDAPKELGGIRYCMNSASLRFIPKSEMEQEGYGEYLALFG